MYDHAFHLNVTLILSQIWLHFNDLIRCQGFDLHCVQNLGSVKVEDQALALELVEDVMLSDILADLLDIEHLLEDGVRIVEKFGMQSHLHE